MRNTISFIGVALAVALLGVAAQKRPPNYNPSKMPDTDFDCSDKIIGGYYGDAETECQMFHVCVKVPGIGVQDFRFLCPNDTAFDQENQICDDWYNIDCAGQLSSPPRPPGSRPSPTPIPLGPSTTRPAVQQAAQGPKAVPQGLPPAPRTKPIASNHAGEEDDDFFLQRADTGDRRLHHGTSRDLFKGSQSGNFFNSKNGGKDDDDDYEPDTRPNAFRHSQKAKNPGPLPSFVQQYQQQQQLQQQRPVNQQQSRPVNNQQQPAQQQQQQQRPNNNNNFQQQRTNNAQQTTQPPRQTFPTTQSPRQTFPTTQQPRQTFPTTQPPRQNFPTTQPPRQNFQQQNFQQQPNFQQQQQNFQQPDAFAQQNNQQRKKKVTVRRKLVQKGDQDQEQNFQQKQNFQQQQQQQQPQQQFQQQPRRFEEDEEYYRTYTIDQHSNVDSPNQAFGQRGNFPAIRTTIAPITHGPTASSQTQGFPSGAPTTAYTAAATATTVVDAARNHNYQTKARYNTIQRSRGEQPTTATEYFTSPSTPAPTTTTQQKQYSLFYAKQQQQQQQQTTIQTTPQPFQQRGSSPAAATTTTNNNNRFNYNTYKLNNNDATTADDYEHPEEQEFLKTAHSNNYRASDFNSFNRATTYNKDNGNSAYNTKASTASAAANQTTAATKPSSAFPVYFPTSPRPAPFSPPQTTPPPQRQATSASSAGTTQQQTSAAYNNNNNFYSPQNAPRPFSPSPAPQSYSPTSAPSTVAAFNNQFNSRPSSPSRGSPATAATTAAPPPPPPKKYTAKVSPNQQASPTAAAPLRSTAAAVAPKNDYDYAYYDDSDAGAYEYGLDPISDSHFAKTRTDSVKIKKDQ